MPPVVHMTHVFGDGPAGGNPAPIVLDADGLSDTEMRQIARDHGHEAGFVLTAPEGFDHALRFWVPNHEMPMCGHATVGALWVLRRQGRVRGDRLKLWTPGVVVHARLTDDTIEISQPEGVVETVPEVDDILAVLGITPSDLAPFPIQNASTARVKTLVPVADVATLDSLQPDFARVQEVCARIGSTGLYPYAPSGDRRFDARQFPRSSGYPEDAATGIAATALAFGALANGLIDRAGGVVRVRQGRAMGRPSEIRLRFADDGLWLGGEVR